MSTGHQNGAGGDRTEGVEGVASKPAPRAPGIQAEPPAAGLGAAATVHHQPNVHATDAPPTTSPVDPMPVIEQLVEVLEPLRVAPEGRSEVSLELRPAELGIVRVEVRVENGIVHLHMHADQDGTADLLRQSAPDLRAALEQAGLSAGSLAVGTGGADGQNQGRRETSGSADHDNRGRRGAPRSEAGDLASAPGRARAHEVGGLDVLL